MVGTVESEREYLRTHPWITFGAIDLHHAGAELWMLLGEGRSKVDHLSLALLKPEAATNMLAVYLAKGAHATTAIEGNTLSEAEVVDIVEGRAEPPPPSQEYLYQEVRNIIDAYNRITTHLVGGGDPSLSVEQICAFNREVLAELDQEDVRPGEIRRHSVVVGQRYRGAPWQDCQYLLGRLCEWLNGPDFTPASDEWKIPLALIKAIIAHLYMVWIHPFDDGNGRTARLIEVQILLSQGVPMPAAHLLSNHYNTTREEYYRQLDRASRTQDVVPFIRYAIQGFVDGIRHQVMLVWDHQYADRWEQFIYETFGGRTNSEAERRRLRLALELSKADGAVSRRDIPGLAPELTVAYSGTQRMLSRDLNTLGAMGLIVQVRRGLWRAAQEQILAFRTRRREDPADEGEAPEAPQARQTPSAS